MKESLLILVVLQLVASASGAAVGGNDAATSHPPSSGFGAPRLNQQLPLTNHPARASLNTTSTNNPGDEVVVVYNRRLPESRSLAEYYAERRQVPKAQVFGFDLSTNEAISRAEFRDDLQQPLAQAIAANKLWHIGSHLVRSASNHTSQVQWKPLESKIRYAVLCYGVPLKILPDPGLKEEGLENLRPEMRRNEAAVDSELAMLPLLEQNPPLAGPLHNPAYGVTNAAALHPTNGVLLVTRLDGPSAEIARGLVGRALLAETVGLWGRAYFDLRNTTEPGLKAGDDWIRSASEICRRLGLETVVEDTPETFRAGFPMSQIAIYIGWYSQDVCGPFAAPKVEFMPGAFAYHLHSYSAVTLRSATRGWVGPLLAKGVTCTMGCVDEPYLGGTPEVGVFTARLLYEGFTFGEAAYASQPVLSWQTTVVGDPLYRPFGKSPEQLQDELQAAHSKWLEWYYLRLLNFNLANGRPVAGIVQLIEQLGTTKESAVLTEKLGDLYLSQGKPSSAVHAYAEALKLSPSPQQQLRLRLELGERLAALERDSEAYDDYEKLLEEDPGYPDRLTIYRKLLPLAGRLNKTTEAARWESEINRLTQPVAPPKS